MFTSIICAFSFCVSVSSSVRYMYIVPPALVEPLKPKGLRVSIPDEEGITLMAFHGNVNIPFEGLDAGEMSRDILRKRGDRWVFEDKKIRFKIGDVIYYWIYVILDGLGYQGLGRNHTVTDFISIENLGNMAKTDSSPYQNSFTTLRGIAVYPQQLVFDANFQNNFIDPNIWFQESKIGGSNNDDEFVVFDKHNSRVTGYKLEIQPSLTENKYNVTFLRNGKLSAEGCTSSEKQYCKKKARGYSILPPVLSSRLSTKNSFSFRYGQVEIKAKLPLGDWIVPELWLESKEVGSTGRIVIGLARGNLELSEDGQDISAKTLTAGVVFGPGKSEMLRKESSIPWTLDFHIFRLVWTKSSLIFLVDNQEIGRIDYPDFLTFNIEYYITLGVHVGGLRDFPDSTAKPWKNTDPKGNLVKLFDSEVIWIKRMNIASKSDGFMGIDLVQRKTLHLKRVYTFWSNRENWSKTWNSDSTLLVEYVRVWSL